MARRKKNMVTIRIVAEFELDLNEVPIDYVIDTKQEERLMKGEELFMPSAQEIAALLVGEFVKVKSGPYENMLMGDITEATVISPQRERLSEKASLV